MNQKKSLNERLLSIDTFRGITIFLLLVEHIDLYYLLSIRTKEYPLLNQFMMQFYHHDWNGMYFWDMIQPYFTFIIGVAMVFSMNKRWERGETWLQTFKHMLYRCSVLFILGIILQSALRGELVWELWNILTIFSVSILITFFVFRCSSLNQFIISIGLILITELLYRFFSIEGFNEPFNKHHNFGSYVDLLLMGKLHPDGWVFFAAIPTTAHMIWGVLTGKLLIGDYTGSQKTRLLTLLGINAVVIGYAMEAIGISPINKHIGTSSFIIASGGWCLLTFALFYWLIDIKGYKKWTHFFVVFGMNPIFIYFLSRAVGRDWFYPFVAIFTKGTIGRLDIPEGLLTLFTGVIILSIEWHICYWLYKRKIFIKI